MYDLRESLIQGTMYRVRYRGGFIVPREGCMKLIDIIDAGETLIFSARPRFGTQRIPMRSVIELECMPPDSLVYVSWRVTSKQPPAKWKYEA